MLTDARPVFLELFVIQRRAKASKPSADLPRDA